jgi:hypothetical protein
MTKIRSITETRRLKRRADGKGSDKGSGSVMAMVPNLGSRPDRGKGDYEFVMAGLAPAIHVLLSKN